MKISDWRKVSCSQISPETTPWPPTWDNQTGCTSASLWAWVHTCTSILLLVGSLRAWIPPRTRSSVSGCLLHRTLNTPSKDYVPSSKANKKNYITYLMYAHLFQECKGFQKGWLCSIESWRYWKNTRLKSPRTLYPPQIACKGPLWRLS